MPPLKFQSPEGQVITVDSPDGSIPTEQELDQLFSMSKNLPDQPAKLNFLGQLGKSFQNTGVGLARGIAEPVIKNVIARPMIGLESAISGKPPVSFRYPFPGFLGGDINVEPIKTIPQAVGAALQTGAVLSPVRSLALAGAAYAGGGAMENRASGLDISKNVALGGTFGKVLGMAGGEPLLTGEVGKFARNRIAPVLEKGAEKSYGKVLGATTKSEKILSGKLVPRLTEERPFVWTRGGLLRASERNQTTSGEALGEAYSNLNPKDKLSIRPILDTIEGAQKDLKVNGVLLEQNKTEASVLDNLRQDLVDIVGRGKTSPGTLREYRQQLDGFIAARKRGFALSDADSSALNSRRIMANAIRKELANKYPDIAGLNSEFSFQSNMVDLLESTVQKQKGVLSKVGGVVGEVAGHKAAGLIVKNLGSLFSDNVAWNSLAGGMKSRLSELLAKGDVEAAHYSLVGAMNDWNRQLSSTAGKFGSFAQKGLSSLRKPLPVYGSRDEFLSSAWKDLMKNQRGSIRIGSGEGKVDQFIRVATKNETVSQSAKNKAFDSFPKIEGQQVVYKPYGEQGKGFYYVPEGGRTGN